GSTLDLDAHEGPVVLAFWAAIAGSEPLLAWLAGRPLATRARAASFLARHAASAPAVDALLSEPDPGEEGAAARARQRR
ncbi:MAG: hypothetical protein ABIO70_34160, partial [Pseudomonadota bacterium]